MAPPWDHITAEGPPTASQADPASCHAGGASQAGPASCHAGVAFPADPPMSMSIALAPSKSRSMCSCKRDAERPLAYPTGKHAAHQGSCRFMQPAAYRLPLRGCAMQVPHRPGFDTKVPLLCVRTAFIPPVLTAGISDLHKECAAPPRPSQAARSSAHLRAVVGRRTWAKRSTPPCSRMPSHTPSPSMNPESSTDTLASGRHTSEKSPAGASRQAAMHVTKLQRTARWRAPKV